MQRDHFTRWLLWALLKQDTETAMGSLPLLILTPVLAATFAAFLATSQPPERVRHGLVIGPSTWSNLILAVVGGVGGVVLAAVLTYIALWGVYLRRGDSSWRVQGWFGRPAGTTEPDSFGSVTLQCSSPGIGAMDLGDYECWIEAPSGQVWELLDGSYTGGGSMISAMFEHLVDGKHHVRWYATKRRGKHVELARGRSTWTVSAWPRRLGLVARWRCRTLGPFSSADLARPLERGGRYRAREGDQGHDDHGVVSHPLIERGRVSIG